MSLLFLNLIYFLNLEDYISYLDFYQFFFFLVFNTSKSKHIKSIKFNSRLTANWKNVDYSYWWRIVWIFNKTFFIKIIFKFYFFFLKVDQNQELDYIEDYGEKGLRLISLILRMHTNRLIKDTIYEKFFTFLRSKKEVICTILKLKKTKNNFFIIFIFFSDKFIKNTIKT